VKGSLFITLNDLHAQARLPECKDNFPILIVFSDADQTTWHVSTSKDDEIESVFGVLPLAIKRTVVRTIRQSGLLTL
jgi:hypothetical protein